MWLVWSYDDGIILTTHDREKVLEEYEKTKQWHKDSLDDEFTTDEHVILVKIEKDFNSYDTGKPVMEEDENGGEIETVDTYWDWKEDIY